MISGVRRKPVENRTEPKVAGSLAPHPHRHAFAGRSTSDLFPVVYQQLRDLAHAKMNREPAGHTLQTTALVHEVYLRLKNDGEGQWEHPRQFFAAAAEA